MTAIEFDKQSYELEQKILSLLNGQESHVIAHVMLLVLHRTLGFTEMANLLKP